MVTPQISGLRNGDALSALKQYGGINCAVGDNTWPFLGAKPDNPHQLLYTTAAVNGFDGFQIIPRFATEIYFNCSTPAQNVALYNKVQPPDGRITRWSHHRDNVCLAAASGILSAPGLNTLKHTLLRSPIPSAAVVLELLRRPLHHRRHRQPGGRARRA
jgi:hypothetical protein